MSIRCPNRLPTRRAFIAVATACGVALLGAGRGTSSGGTTAARQLHAPFGTWIATSYSNGNEVDIAVADADHAWAITDSRTWAYDGTEWRFVPNPGQRGDVLTSVYARDAENAWIGGWRTADVDGVTCDCGFLWRWDNDAWVVDQPVIPLRLQAVAVPADDFGLVIGEAGVPGGARSFAWNGAHWLPVAFPGHGSRLAVASAASAWAIDASGAGALVRFAAGSWAPWPLSDTPSIDDIEVAGDDFGVLFGPGGVIRHWDGAAWAAVESPVEMRALDIALASPDDGWATGAAALLHWDGNDWVIVDDHGALTIRHLDVTEPDIGWGVNQRQFVRYDLQVPGAISGTFTPTPLHSATPAATPTALPTQTPTPTIDPFIIPTWTHTPTYTPDPSETPGPSPTPGTPTPSVTPRPTWTLSPTPSPGPSPTSVPTSTHEPASPTVLASPTHTPTVAASGTSSALPADSATPTDTSTESPTPAEQPSTVPPTASPAATTEPVVVTLRATDYRFDPSEFTVRAGETISIVLHIDVGRHDIVVDLGGGETARSPLADYPQTTGVRFTAPAAPGTYFFYCSLGSHRANGMEGRLVVTLDGLPLPSPAATSSSTHTPLVTTPPNQTPSPTPEVVTSVTSTSTVPATATDPPIVPPTVSPTATDFPTPTASPSVLTLRASGTAFDPIEVTARAGEPISMVLHNDGGTHNVVVDLGGGAFASAPIVDGGQTTGMRFTAPAVPGTYAFYCAVDNHRALGMSGRLVVVQDVPAPSSTTAATTVTPSPSPSPSPSPEPTPSPDPTPTRLPSLTPEPTPSPTSSPSATPDPPTPSAPPLPTGGTETALFLPIAQRRASVGLDWP